MANLTMCLVQYDLTDHPIYCLPPARLPCNSEYSPPTMRWTRSPSKPQSGPLTARVALLERGIGTPAAPPRPCAGRAGVRASASVHRAEELSVVDSWLWIHTVFSKKFTIKLLFRGPFLLGRGPTPTHDPGRPTYCPGGPAPPTPQLARPGGVGEGRRGDLRSAGGGSKRDATPNGHC